MFKSVVIAVLGASLAACGAPRPRALVPHPAAGLQGLRALPAPGMYSIDTANSELRILVYRAGPLANLGHNHVMVSRALTGNVQLGASVPESAFSFGIPVASLEVDDAQARRDEGSDFPGEIPQEARSGTRHNMLGAALLNATQFPELRLDSISLTGPPGEPTAELRISVAGHESQIFTRFVLQGDADRLTASGSMELRQTAIGLTPYSLMRGALQVQDAMLVKFKIVVAVKP